jgi:hypothetical protein
LSYLKVVLWIIGNTRGSPFFGSHPACTHNVSLFMSAILVIHVLGSKVTKKKSKTQDIVLKNQHILTN